MPAHIKAVVTSRVEITGQLWIVRIRPEESVSFSPGQYLTVGLPGENKLIERPYSVASAPRDSELEFFLEVVESGKLSPQLHQVPVGGQVFLRPSAKGRFAFESGTPNHFMAATVTGIAPFVSMVRNLVGEPQPVPYRLTILHSASVSAELAYREEMAACAQREPWLEYIPTISRIWLDPAWSGERGRAEDVARKYLDATGFQPSSTTAYLCGNPHMIRAMEAIFERAGFPKGSVRKELYWPSGGAP